MELGPSLYFKNALNVKPFFLQEHKNLKFTKILTVKITFNQVVF